MKLNDVRIHWQSDTVYRAEDDVHVYLEQTTRLTEKIYRSIYPSEKKNLDTAIYLKNLRNVTLDFGGATLLLHDETIQPFVLDGCEDITIQNVTVEYERGWMEEIDIIAADAEQIVLRQTEEQKKKFPIKVEDGQIIPISQRGEYRNTLTDPHFLNLYDGESGEIEGMCLVRIGKNLSPISKEAFPFHYYELCAEEQDGTIVLKGEIPPLLRAGQVSAQTHSARDISSIFLIRSKNIRLENVRIINGAGMGILGMYTENLTLHGVRYTYDERSHGMSSNAADAVHLISTHGVVRMTDCVFEGMKDDALNLHGNYYVITEVTDGAIVAKIPTDVQKSPALNAYFQMFGAGDSLSVCRNSSIEKKTICTVKRVEILDDFHVRIALDGQLDHVRVGDTVENLSSQAELFIKRCRFGKARTHLRLQTGGKIRIEDCDCSLRILLPGDKKYWYEGSPVRDLTVQNCRFRGERGQIIVRPDSFEKTEAEPYYHKGIKILSNRFETTEALFLHCCDGVVFRGNENIQGKPFVHHISDCGTVETDS